MRGKLTGWRDITLQYDNFETEAKEIVSAMIESDHLGRDRERFKMVRDNLTKLVKAAFFAGRQAFIDEVNEEIGDDMDRRAEVQEDADRWRAFVSSARFKMIGSANIVHENYPDGPISIKEDIHPDDWIHFGLEVWDRHPVPDDAQGRHGRKLLMTYVDHMVERRVKDLRPATAVEAALANKPIEAPDPDWEREERD